MLHEQKLKNGGMMTEKRFRVNDLVKYNYSEIGEYIDENHTDRPLRNDEVVELLNELYEENKQLKKHIEEHSIDEKLLDDLYFNQVGGI